MKIVFPAQNVSIQKRDQVEPVWYDKFKAIESFANLFSEVDPRNITNGYTLVWDSTTSKFLPGAGGGGGGGMSIGGAITGGTANSVLFVGSGSTLAEDATHFSWNDATDTLGVNGTSNFTGTITAPTVAGTDNSTHVATTAFVKGLGYGTGQMTWVPYTTTGQAFVAQNLTRDGDWTMVAKANTTDRPAPQPSGAEEDLLPGWTPNRQSAVGALTIYNEWTVNTGGWIDQYGVDILRQNVGDTHTILLSINGTTKDTFTAVAATEGIYWHDITPIVVASGATIRVTLQISATGSNSWFEQPGLFATAPV